MPRLREDLTGMRFGKLTALSLEKYDNNNNPVWVFRCDCGKQTALSSSKVKRGKAACECNVYPKMPKNSILTIKERTKLKHKKEYVYLLDCACGAQINMIPSQISKFHHTDTIKFVSCGCANTNGNQGYYAIPNSRPFYGEKPDLEKVVSPEPPRPKPWIDPPPITPCPPGYRDIF